MADSSSNPDDQMEHSSDGSSRDRSPLKDEDLRDLYKPDKADGHKDDNNGKSPPGKSDNDSRQAPKRRSSVITISDDSDDSHGSSICHIDSYQATRSEAKRLRRDSDYSTSDSSSDYSDDESDSEEDDDSLVITNPPSSWSLLTVELLPRAPKLLQAQLNSSFISEDLEKDFLTNWNNKTTFVKNSITLHSEPFRVCILDEFLQDPNIVNNIIDDMTTMDWSRRKMDLYEFHRTNDLKDLTWQRGIRAVYELLQESVMKWISRITDTKLTHVSASCALYGPGDHLLVHDDRMADRKIAFILYLCPWDISRKPNKDSEPINKDAETIDKDEKTIDKDGETINKDGKTIDKDGETIDKPTNSNSESQNEAVTNSETCDDSKYKLDTEERSEKGWTKSMGGALEFLELDSNGQPLRTVRSLLPCNNTFAFFKVGKDSFHQVAEVMSFDFPRLTINGWFHGPTDEEDSAAADAESAKAYRALGEKAHTDLYQALLNELITSSYLYPRTQFKIQQHMEASSEISLESFFLEDHYSRTMEDLEDSELPWKLVGPANLRKYEMLELDKLEASTELTGLNATIKLFTCSHFFRLLTEFTELKLKKHLRFEVQKWSAGCYSVLPPKSEYAANELDVLMYLGLPDKKLWGGSTIYLAPEDENSDPLVSIELNSNALNLIYSDDGTTKFTKYISKFSMKKGEYFYIISCSYREF